MLLYLIVSRYSISEMIHASENLRWLEKYLWKLRYINGCVWTKVCINIRYSIYSYSVKLDKHARWRVVETVLLTWRAWPPIIDVDRAYVTILRRRGVVTDLLVSTSFRQEWRIDVFCRNRRETRIRLYLIYFEYEEIT